jgi:peptidoglycan/LPS O-acetylase OafA/YrhL
MDVPCAKDASPAACPVGARFHLGYRRWLDGLRGVAILMVLAYHLGVLPGGSLGVDVFFVLSGFLITTLLAEEWQRRGSISLGHFYLRRALRLLPAFVTLLLLYGLSTWLLRSPAESEASRWEILVAGCYLANWPSLHGISMNGLGHTWSLSIEEQFYLLWPALLAILLARGVSRRRILWLVGAGIVGCIALRITLYHVHRAAGMDKATSTVRLYMGLDTRADSLLVGCLVGLLAAWDLLPRTRRFVRWTGLAALASILVLAYLARYSAETQTIYYHGLFTLVAGMVAVVLVRLLAAPSRIGGLVLQSALLVGVGRISYGLYLYHVLVIYWLRPTGLGWDHPRTMAAALGLSFGAAIVSYFGIERPCLRLKDRLGHRAVMPPQAVESGAMSAPPQVAA